MVWCFAELYLDGQCISTWIWIWTHWLIMVQFIAIIVVEFWVGSATRVNLAKAHFQGRLDFQSFWKTSTKMPTENIMNIGLTRDKNSSMLQLMSGKTWMQTPKPLIQQRRSSWILRQIKKGMNSLRCKRSMNAQHLPKGNLWRSCRRKSSWLLWRMGLCVLTMLGCQLQIP